MKSYTAAPGSSLAQLEQDYTKLSDLQIIALKKIIPTTMLTIYSILDVLQREGVDDANNYPVETILGELRMAVKQLLL